MAAKFKGHIVTPRRHEAWKMFPRNGVAISRVCGQNERKFLDRGEDVWELRIVNVGVHVINIEL